ncbi:MAG TPA: 50S ribosomal protein L21 [Chlamydiales bacterium]|nr:50S ribosomal protein L21 [Chlamydiales bacterium]
MYAIIETGGKQYKVQEGDVVDVDLIHSEQKTLQFDKVLLFNDGAQSYVGAPHLPKYVVFADLIGECKGEKVIAFKYKRCKNYRRTVGHRQKYSRVKITRITAA